MRKLKIPVILILVLATGSCITPFLPETEEEKDMLVVKGMITDMYGINKIKLTRSVPIERKNQERPYTGCTVKIIDDLGHTYLLKENRPGEYATSPEQFQGMTGRQYKLTIDNNRPNELRRVYESGFIEMIQVPQIDSIYYEKTDVDSYFGIINGCQIYLDTHDPLNRCRNYRWEFAETWEFHNPFPDELDAVEHDTCWMSKNSEIISVKSTSLMAEDRVTRFPLHYIPPWTDRFKVKYSILVTQYSIDEQEYDYWSKIRNITEEVGSLYDITPTSVPGNIYCIDDPAETVLGYFSVSSVCSKRIFIKDTFVGDMDRYLYCMEGSKTVYNLEGVEGLNSQWFIIGSGYLKNVDPYWVLSRFEDCSDCRLTGTEVEPPFWHDDE
jgi:hypothetical protein